MFLPPKVQIYSSLLMPLFMVDDDRRRLLLARKVNKAVDAKFPDNTETHFKLGLYAAGRASQLRRMRIPRPLVSPRRQDRLNAARVRTLVLGGIRSGKSRWAESALSRQPAVRYLATGPHGGDDEPWARRIAEHRSRRPASWSTVETADVATELSADPHTATLVDDLGNWLTADAGPSVAGTADRCRPRSTTCWRRWPGSSHHWCWSARKWD